MKKDLAVVILAAGKSTRMKSQLPKVLHHLCGRHMLAYVLDIAKALRPQKTLVVVGFGADKVKEIIPPGVEAVLQKRLLGTADAVRQTLPFLKNFFGTLLVLYGDTPLLKLETIKKLISFHQHNQLSATLLTAHMDNPKDYGRILRDEYSAICGIVEEKEATEYQQKIKEINTGIMCFDVEKLRLVMPKIKPAKRKKEYYLTDAISILYKMGFLVDALKTEDPNEVLGINSRLDLAKAIGIMQKRINEEHMRKGVSIIDPNSTYIDYGVKIGQDSVIYPFTVIESNVRIGKGCFVGPFARIRSGSCLKDKCQVGNFIEIVRSTISSQTKAKHFGYLGDSVIGRGVNIGAGTVVANYDGKNKHPTLIRDGAFLGSDTVLIAPVVVGKNSATGAGSVVTKNTKIADNEVFAGVPARFLRKR